MFYLRLLSRHQAGALRPSWGHWAVGRVVEEPAGRTVAMAVVVAYLCMGLQRCRH